MSHYRLMAGVVVLMIAATAFSQMDGVPGPNHPGTSAGASSLTGTVVDQQGAVIPDAEVTATNRQGVAFRSETGADGAFKLALPKGHYLLEVRYTRHNGWKPSRRRIIVPGHPKPVTIVLRVNITDPHYMWGRRLPER